MTGHRFESSFIRSLEAFGFRTKSSLMLDHEKKTDCLILKVDGYTLPKPYKIQVTMRMGDQKKIRDFMDVCNGVREAAFYVEVEYGVRPDQAAFSLKRCVQGFLSSNKIVCGLYVLSVRSSGSTLSDARPFLAQVEASKAASAARHRGCINRRMSGAFHVSGDDGGSYLAFATDIVDSALRKTLEQAHPDRRLPKLVRVSFDIDDADGIRRARKVVPSRK